MQRRSVLLPPPDGPTIAMVSPRSTEADTPSSTTRSPWFLQSVRTLITRQPPLESSRQLRQRDAEQEVERRARQPGNQPAAQVGAEDLVALGQLDDRDRPDQRAVLEQRHEV